MADESFDDEALEQALRAPGTASELGEEERYVAMYREARPVPGSGPRRRSGAARRLGTGTALVITLGIAGGGVAAAYSGNLPDPIQDFVHEALGPVAPPPADDNKRRDRATDRATEPTPAPSTSAPTPTPSEPQPSSGPTGGPTKDPASDPGPQQSPNEGPTPTAEPAQTTAPSGTPTPTPEPTASPSPTPPPAVVTAVSISGSARRVDVGGVASFSGVVTDQDGAPIAGVNVALQRRGPGGWERVAKAPTDDSGAISLSAPPTTETTGYRLRIGRVHSSRWRVAMHPLLSVSANKAEGSDDSFVIGTSAQGGSTGDRVRLLMQKPKKRVVVAEGFLDANGSVQFLVTPTKRHTSYILVLRKTVRHTASESSIRISKETNRH